MLTYALIFLLGGIVITAFRRVLAVLLVRALGVLSVVVAARLALMADASPSALSGAVVGGVVAFIVVGVLAYTIIYHSLIAADEQRDVDRARETAKRRRLW